MKILITCPPMLGMMDRFGPLIEARGLEYDAPEVRQTLDEDELVKCVGDYDGWIIGDDPASRSVFEAGSHGRLQAAVKWGVGVDNVDFDAAHEFEIAITHTPQMFGEEVADVALGYLIALARELFSIDRAVREGGWSKPRGISLAGKRAALVGFGDIGRALARRLLALGMQVNAYDPRFVPQPGLEAVVSESWPNGLESCDALLFVCALTKENRHMLGAAELHRIKSGVRIVNVSRGPLIDETALAHALGSGQVHSAALDVFEEEPLPEHALLRDFGERVLFGSHNASNTEDAVIRASHRALDALCGFLGVAIDEGEQA
jgi:D-3-phosphoglycerate dehydrogenase